MAVILNQDFSITFTVEYYYFVEAHQTHEYHYSCVIKHFNLPIIYGIYQNNRTELFDFELNDYKLSDLFHTALTSKQETELDGTWDGDFHIIIKPNNAENWQIRLEFGSLYFENTTNDTFQLAFGMTVTTDCLAEFVQKLANEEMAITQKKSNI